MNNDSSIATLAAILRSEADRLGAGDRLPSSRELVRRYGVSPVTVSGAIAMLTAEGRVVTRPGSGAYVAPRHTAEMPDTSWQTVALGDRVVDDSAVTSFIVPPADGVIPLTGGYLNREMRPTKALTAAAGRAVRRAEAWDVPPVSGIADLRRWFAKEAGATQDDVIITNGGQGALTHAFRALAGPGDPVLVETPTYPGALASAKAAGLRATAVPIDRDGVRPDLLAEAFAVTGARVFFCQPTVQNPTGATLPRERREQVLAVARAAGAFVIEDEYARYFATGPTPPTLVSLDTYGTVVHINSLSKISAPSVRVAGLVARGQAARRIRASQVVESFYVARALQETALEFVTSPAWRRHVATVHAEVTTRQAALLSALARHLPAAQPHLAPRGGMHLWVRLPPDVDEAALVAAAGRAGVLVSPGAFYYPSEPPGPRLRLTHTAPLILAEIEEGIRRLAQAF